MVGFLCAVLGSFKQDGREIIEISAYLEHEAPTPEARSDSAGHPCCFLANNGPGRAYFLG